MQSLWSEENTFKNFCTIIIHFLNKNLIIYPRLLSTTTKKTAILIIKKIILIQILLHGTHICFFLAFSCMLVIYFPYSVSFFMKRFLRNIFWMVRLLQQLNTIKIFVVCGFWSLLIFIVSIAGPTWTRGSYGQPRTTRREGILWFICSL